MSSGDRDVSRFLTELNDKLAAIDAERLGIAQREQAVADRERGIEQTWERKYAAKLRELERRAAELSSEFEHKAQETIEDLSQKARARISRTRREYQEAVEALAPAPAPAAANLAPRLKLEEGVRVRLKGIRQPATVRRVLSEGLLEVDAGFLKMRVPTADVEEIFPAGGGAVTRPAGVTMKQGPAFDGSYREINLIGQRAEHACEQVDKFLDTAALGEVERVRIVHGHGMGSLKRAIAELLKENPHVAKLCDAPQEQGGGGATIVELK